VTSGDAVVVFRKRLRLDNCFIFKAHREVSEPPFWPPHPLGAKQNPETTRVRFSPDQGMSGGCAPLFEPVVESSDAC
jgi:hypothetical protein